MRDRMARHIETILSAAVDYCSADELDASARAQFEQLKTDHHGGDVCCVPAPGMTMSRTLLMLCLVPSGASAAKCMNGVRLTGVMRSSVGARLVSA